MIDTRRLINGLERTAPLMNALLSDLPAGGRAAPDAWSAVEIAAHLLDEEREDFRLRLEYTLERPGEAWPGIDPPGWVTERRYAERDLAATLSDFLREREASLHWLRTLRDTDWELAYEHPSLGVIRAGDLLASWAGHDLLHLRQILRLRWALTGAAAEPFRLDYAGSW